MSRTTEATWPLRSVPLARRQLLAQPTKLAIAVAAVGCAAALVLLLSGLRRGMGEQVTTYLDRQPPVLVGGEGLRDFIGQTSVLPDSTVLRVGRVPGVADAAPITSGFAMLTLHSRRVLALLVGSDRGRRGGPWRMAAGRPPAKQNEIAVDRVLARRHGLEVGGRLAFRGVGLRIVGLTSGTNGFMTPLIFTTRETANALNALPQTATFVLVTPVRGLSGREVIRRVERSVPGVTARLREDIASNDRDLFVGAFSGPLTLMVAIASAVAVLVIGLTTYSSTRDRAREYVTLAAIGLSRGALLRLVSLQATALSLIGTTLGIALAAAGGRAVAALAPSYLVVLDGVDVIRIAAAAVAFGVVGAVVPARYVARLDPASAFGR